MTIGYLTRRATFSASHRLHSNYLSDAENQKIFGKCNGIHGHGHNYVIEVTIRGQIDHKTGIIINITDLKQIMEETVLSKVDHRYLNLEVKPFDEINPTAENMAVIFWDWLEKALPEKSLFEVKLHETENNVAVFRGEKI